MADLDMTRVDEVLEQVISQADLILSSKDSTHKLRVLLEPVRELFVRILAEKDSLLSASAPSVDVASRIKAQHYWTEAATRIQAIVRGKNQRVQLRKQVSFHLQGTKVLKQYVLKQDRFPNCHVLDSSNNNHTPNFRRLEGTPLYGTAQPTLQGIQQIIKRVAEDGFTDIVWINLREEGVIYVNGMPYTARRSAKLNENDLVPGITGHTVQVLEASMKNSLQHQLELSNAKFEYWYEVQLHENMLMVEENVTADKVLTLNEIYDLDAVRKASPSIQSLTYYRIPIERENAPEHADVERMTELIGFAFPQVPTATPTTAFVFNCQMGKRRTTTALVLGSLIWHRPQLSTVPIHIPVMPPPTPPFLSPNNSLSTLSVVRPNRDDGNFTVIQELMKRLPHGKQAKQWVDATIDACAAILNIRTVIHEYHELSNSEAKPAKRSYYLHHALSFLERYFYLIVYAAYTLTTQPQDKPYTGTTKDLTKDADNNRIQSFSKWLQHHPNLFRLLDDMGGVKYRSDKVLQNAVLKFDHFPGIARIPYTLTPNVPNFRQIDNEPIFGSAQCLEDGIKDVVIHYQLGGFDRAVWINLREEAVLYVSGKPFVIRHSDNLMENVEYPGIEVDEIVAIEQQVKDEMTMRVRRANGLFMYWHEPRDMVNEERIEHINPDLEIKTLREIYEEVADDTGFDVKYARIPVSDETAPEEKDLDDMVRLLAPAFIEEFGLGHDKCQKKRKTAVICNCQMGRGRTTTAVVCIYMLRLLLEDVKEKRYQVDTPRMLLDSILGTGTPIRQSRKTKGEFAVIRKLCQTLENGAAAKSLVDVAVDKCEHLQNLRECIAQCRDLAVDRELSSSKHDSYMLRAVNYLERYFYLICFASYLLEEREHLFQRTLFVTWMNERYGSALYALLDNLYFEEEVGAETHASSMRWRWRRKRKLISRLD